MIFRFKTITTKNFFIGYWQNTSGLISRKLASSRNKKPLLVATTKTDVERTTVLPVVTKESGIRKFVAKTQLYIGGSIICVLCADYCFYIEPTALTPEGWALLSIGITTTVFGGCFGVGFMNYKVLCDREKGDNLTPATTFLYSEQSLARKAAYCSTLFGICLITAPWTLPIEEFVHGVLYTTLTCGGAAAGALSKRTDYRLQILSPTFKGAIYTLIVCYCIADYFTITGHPEIAKLLFSDTSCLELMLLVIFLYKTNTAVADYLRGDPDHLRAGSLLRLL